ncbi:MAG: glycoside hydrolase family 88 protein [Bacteroidales bacterium]|nr:glycoside hydrolase family 88 protein [Bacteroidales bacterium]
MKSLLLILILSVVNPRAATDSSVVRQIADYIVDIYQTGYYSGKDGKPYDDPRDIPPDEEIRLNTNYAAWHYTTGIINSALLQYSAMSGENKYAEHTVKHTAYSLQEWNKVRPSVTPTGDWHPFHGLRRFDELDFMGTECGALIDMEGWFGTDEYEELIQRAAEHIRHGQARFPDGTLVRTWPKECTLWADDLFMGLSFMTRYAMHYGDSLMLKDAILQVDNFNKYLWDDDAKLFWHAWFQETQANAGVHWGRCNGWVLRATVDLLDCLDPDSDDFKRIQGYLQRHVDGLRARQRPNGMWMNVLDSKSFDETSCTALFAGSIAHAIRNQWIDTEYSDMVFSAWNALKDKYIVDGQLNKVCIGTGIMDSVKDYAKRPTRDGDTHGAGIILVAGMEVLSLQTYLSGEYCCTLRPTFNSCSLELTAAAPIPGFAIEYRKVGQIKWTPVRFIPYYNDQPGYRTSLTRLDENSRYEYRVLINGSQKSIERFQTWNSKVRIAKTVVLDPNHINFPVRINDKGKPDGWIRYTVPEGAVLENRGRYPTFIIDDARYVILEGVTMKGPNIHQGAVNVKNSQNVRILNCEISDWGRVGVMRFDLKGKPAVGNDVINFDGAVKIQQGSSCVVVERCYIHDPAGRTNSWRYSHPSGAEAVIMYKPDHSTVLRYNDFVGGGDKHRFNDSVESFGNFDKDGGFNRDADISGNFLAFCNDDCIELDGGQRNVRCFGNRFESALVGVSIQGCMMSPSFIYDNVFSGLGDEFNRKGMNIKTGSGAHGPQARSYITDNYFGPQGGGIGFMNTLELHVHNNIIDKSTNFASRDSSPQSVTTDNVMNLTLDEKDLPEMYPMRPCPFVLSRQRFTNPKYEFDVTVKPLPELKDSIHFVIRQNYECDWFEVTPSSGYVKAGEELTLHVKLLEDKMQDRRYYRGAFLVRTPEGLSRPCTIYKETKFLPPFKAEKEGDVAVYLDAFNPTSGIPDVVDEKTSPSGKAVRMTKGNENTLEWEFTVPKDGRYYILLHGSGRPFPDVMASVDGSEFKKSEHQTNTNFMIWTILAPGGNFNLRIAYYDLDASKKHTLRLQPGPNKNTKILMLDGIVVTDNPEAFEPR